MPSLYQKDQMIWRAQLNPLAGLSMWRVANVMSMAERGYYPDLMWLYRYVEKRDAVLRAVRHRRIAAIQGLDWQIKVREDAPKSQAKAQQEFLQEKYDKIDNLRAAFQHIANADFRGFAHLEKHYDADGDVFHLECVPQWYWVRRYPSRNWLYNAKGMQIAIGVEADMSNFIVREVEDPIDEIATICFMRKNLSQKDWDGFVETFGIPPIFIELPPGVGQVELYQQMADKVISDGRGVIGNGAKVVPLETGMRGVSPFKAHLDYQDQQIVLAATSGLLTTLTAPTGMNSNQSDTHSDTFDAIAEADAVEISEVFQKQFDESILKAEFPNQDIMVYFELSHAEVGGSEGTQTITDAVQLLQIGYKIDQQQLEEKTGYKLDETDIPGQEQVGDPNADPNADPNSEEPYSQYSDWTQALQNRKRTIRRAQGKFVDAILNVAKTGDEKIVRALENLVVQLPEMSMEE